MGERERAKRPGGRGARVAAAVHQAVTDLIRERGYGTFSVGDVAARAGVADSSIYRRWGSLEKLLTDVALASLNARSPMPDTGSLAGDLHTYADQVAREITGPDGPAMLHLAVALSRSQQGAQAHDDLLAERTRQLESMLDRARARGEDAPDAYGVLDHLLAPMYIRVMLGRGTLTKEYVDGLVERLL
ncbi:TetR/AcrR family transcriptional regulator [Actinocatenispora rupis]|uniref:TetR family transcriptional regulator n=1 Tax=Actinocatenispora rupis TaxID=519421 RepID=A0A8J3NE66_9ACTN|nr:TetR/AcrR family transcriptional regulator [Actinocatenispora rupis]GID16039.1 TetR family transcriptional regulator [Actinocatenispora rupis]